MDYSCFTILCLIHTRSFFFFADPAAAVTKHSLNRESTDTDAHETPTRESVSSPEDANHRQLFPSAVVRKSTVTVSSSNMPMPGAFPLIKLGALAVRQVAKPLANSIKTRAKSSPFFRDYVCMPPAQLYHWLEVNVKMRMLNLGKPREVAKLDQNAAIELGADLLGEFIIFGVAAVTLTLEYMRQSRNSAKAAADLEERWTKVESQLKSLASLESSINQQTEVLTLLTEKLVKEKERAPILHAIQRIQLLRADSDQVSHTVNSSNVSS